MRRRQERLRKLCVLALKKWSRQTPEAALDVQQQPIKSIGFVAPLGNEIIDELPMCFSTLLTNVTRHYGSTPMSTSGTPILKPPSLRGQLSLFQPKDFRLAPDDVGGFTFLAVRSFCPCFL